MKPFIARWRSKAISMFGKSRGLTKTQRGKVTSSVKGGAKRTSKTSRKSNPKTKKVRKTTNKKKGGRKGGRIFGNVGLKGMLMGTALITGLNWVINRFVGDLGGYDDAVAMIGAGAVGKAVKGAGTAHLFNAGIELGLSKLVLGFTTGGRFGVTAQRGYDL